MELEKHFSFRVDCGLVGIGMGLGCSSAFNGLKIEFS